MFDILGAVSSIATGGLTGLIGSGISQFMEHRKQKTEYAHQLASRRLDLEIVEKKAELQIKVKETDANIALEIEAGKDFRNSFDNDKARYVDSSRTGAVVNFLLGCVDVIRGMIRPVATIFFSYLTYSISDSLLTLLGGIDQLPREQLVDLLNRVTQTILYIATTCILWWFGTRPPKMNQYTGGVYAAQRGEAQRSG
jgi:hypothetical protein